MSVAEDLLLDTNVLVYTYDQNEPVKGPIAQTLLARIFAAGRALLSAQVISEFYWTVTRKLPFPLTDSEALAEVMYLRKLTRFVPLTWKLQRKSFDAIVRHQLPL